MSQSTKKQQTTDKESAQFQEITTDEFDKMLKEQNSLDTKKWTDLELGKIYTITHFKTVETSIGSSTVLTLLNNGEVWSPPHLADKINDKEPPFYVRPLGLRPCKGNKKNKYHAYDLVIPNKQMGTSDFMHRDYVRK